MKKTAVNSLLFLGGAILIYEFYIILTRGKVYPFLNIPTFIVYGVLISGAMFFALWPTLKMESVREMLPNALLFGLSGGLLLTHTIFPIIYLTHGNPINSYYGYEPNTVIALGELSFGATVSLCGLYGLMRFAFKQLHAKNPV